MRGKSSQQRYLPPIIIQVFGGAIVLAVLVYGIVTDNASIVLAVFGFAGGCVMIGGYYERANHDVNEASRPPEIPASDTETRGRNS